MFVLAHLSDPHLGPLPTPRLSELAGKRALGFFNWQRRRQNWHRAEVLADIVVDIKANAPDFIAVTGDLVNIALEGEFAPARAWLEALGPAERVAVVPGNHDAYVRATAEHPQLHWGPYLRGDDWDGRSPATFPYVRRRDSVGLVGLSSALPTGPLMATGRLGGDQLAALERVLDELGAEGRFRVVLIHHPPVSPRTQHFKRLIDGAQFRHVLAKHGAELVLHGHDHQHSLVWLDGNKQPIPAMGVPSASAVVEGEDDPAAYNLVWIDGDAGAWRCEAIVRGFRAGGGDEDIVELRREILLPAKGRL
jgi:3',5'-cyclic AMP phosphodiesterase CpdA